MNFKQCKQIKCALYLLVLVLYVILNNFKLLNETIK